MGKLSLPILCVVCVVLVVMLQFGFIFLLLALLPSIVAFYIDRNPGKPTFCVVAACNIASTLPSLVPMLVAAVKFKHSDTSAILANPATWLMVYSGAAMGWCLIYLCNYVGRFIITLSYGYNINALEGQQQRLLEEWGQSIKHTHGAAPE